jgi:RNA polymerase sigma factor (sigma-70 family)
MATEHLVRRAAEGDLPAFVELTRRFQHFAFGSALALVGDFHHAEDVVQEALVAAWSSLPRLADPAAFPGWLRSIVRYHAFRAMRRKHLEQLPLEAAAAVASGDSASDERIEQRQQIHAALAAIGGLPARLREPALLFYVHECSHQDIALFLGLSATTVNNRLHAARSRLKERMLTMVSQTLQSHGLPDDFANRIGRLVEARGQVVEARFDPDALPDLLAELVLSDETNSRPVTVQVIQRPGGGIVRGVTISPVDGVPRGASLLNSLRHADTPLDPEAFERAVTLLAGVPPATAEFGRLLETGIKVIDVMCPLVAGGTVAIAGEYGAGTTVVMEELVRRLSSGADRVSLFTFVQQWDGAREPGFSHAEALRKDGFSEGTIGAVQTFFFRAAEGPWTADRLDELAPVDTVIHLSRGMAMRKIYPCVDVATSRSRLINTGAVEAAHAAIAARAQEALALLCSGACGGSIVIERARKLANYFAQPFFCAEPWTKRAGAHVPLPEALKTCTDILDGTHDDLPTGAFYFAGGIEEIRERAGSAG